MHKAHQHTSGGSTWEPNHTQCKARLQGRHVSCSASSSLLSSSGEKKVPRRAREGQSAGGMCCRKVSMAGQVRHRQQAKEEVGVGRWWGEQWVVGEGAGRQ